MIHQRRRKNWTYLWSSVCVCVCTICDDGISMINWYLKLNWMWSLRIKSQNKTETHRPQWFSQIGNSLNKINAKDQILALFLVSVYNSFVPSALPQSANLFYLPLSNEESKYCSYLNSENKKHARAKKKENKHKHLTIKIEKMCWKQRSVLWIGLHVFFLIILCRALFC